MNTLAMIEQVKTLANQYESVIELAAKLQAIGSLENATMECNTAFAIASEQRTAAANELARVNALLEEADSGVAVAKKEAAALVKGAKTDAAALMEAARLEAGAIFNQAHAEELTARGVVASLRAEAEAIGASIETQRVEYATLVQRIVDAKAAALASLG